MMETSDPTPNPDENAPTTPVQPSFAPHPTIIGRYRILEPIAEGGMGTVYKAEQRTPVVRIVALKVIKLGMDSAAVVNRFNAERQALALMDHPNIAKVFDAGMTEQGRPYFVMEYVPGEPITAYCDRHRLTQNERLQLFAPVCEAVQHAHQKGIIHRDLKPSNILITVRDAKPVPKVIDFGVAKATAQKLTEQTLFTEAGQLIGTPEYMSPEQAEMTGLDVDTRSDVYSLGVVLYELLTGTLPFDTKTLRVAGFAEIQRIIRDVDPPKPSNKFSSFDAAKASVIADRRQIAVDVLARDLRRELEWIPLKAMHKDRTRRYRTATELADDIFNYINGRPLDAAPDSAGYRLRKLLKRNKGPVLAGAAIFLLLIAGIVGTTIGLIGQSRQRVEAMRQMNEANRQRQIAEQQSAEADRQRSAAMAERVRAVGQEEEAKRQAAIAEAVSRFQSDMLSSVDPDKLLGDKVTVLQAMAGSVKELDAGKLKDQPLVEAAVRYTIGKTQYSLGRYPEAEANLRISVDLRRRLSAGSVDLAMSLNDLGWLLRGQNRLSESELLLREALAIYRKSFPATDPQIANSINYLAPVLTAQNKIAESEPLLREAVDIYRKALPRGREDLAMGLSNLATLLSQSGRIAEAEPLVREALENDRIALPPGHPRLGISLNNLGMFLKEEGKLSEAEPLIREALDVQRKALPEGHPQVAAFAENLGDLLTAQRRYADAEPLIRESLAARKKSLQPGDRLIAYNIRCLADTLLRLNRLNEAEASYRELIDLERKAPAEYAPYLPVTITTLAQVLHRQPGRLIEAEALYREALELRKKTTPRDDPEMAIALNNLGSALQDEKRYEEAEPLLREAVEIFRKKPAVVAADQIQTYRNLAKLLHSTGHDADMVAVYRESLKFAQLTCKPNDLAIPQCMNDLSQLLIHLKQPADAEPVQWELVAWGEKYLGASDSRVVSSMSVLADILRDEGKLDEAESLYLKSEGLVAAAPEIPAAFKREAIADLASFYEFRKNAVEASKWRDKLAQFDLANPSAVPQDAPNATTAPMPASGPVTKPSE